MTVLILSSRLRNEIAPHRYNPRVVYQQKLEENVPSYATLTTAEQELASLQKAGVHEIPGLGDVAVVGAGIAGLSAALKLQGFSNTNVTIFEADDRIGGRLFSHHFSERPSVYFEAGGMRLPDTHRRVFKLIEELNGKLPEAEQLELIPYHMSSDSARVYVNGKRDGTTGKTFTKGEIDKGGSHLLGFPDFDQLGSPNASDLLADAVKEPLDRLKNAAKISEEVFQAEFRVLMKEYDNISFRQYLVAVKHWSADQLNYVETMTDQTNAFQVSFMEQLMDNYEFESDVWKTIKGGMQRLPEACANIFTESKGVLNLNTNITEIRHEDDKIVLYGKPTGVDKGPIVRLGSYDKLLLAIPPIALKMIQTPQWPVEKMIAIRSMRYDPIRKIGLLFKTRWWEHLKTPIYGGQSVTDLPSRWIVYPSNDIGASGPGALLCYSWTSDAYAWMSLDEDKEEKERIALRDLIEVHGGEGIDIEGEFLESFVCEWPLKRAGGIAFFFPSTWASVFNSAKAHEGEIYFAGEHLSVHHAWIEGALDSSEVAVQQMVATHARTTCLPDPAKKPSASPRSFLSKDIRLLDILSHDKQTWL